MPKTVVNSKSLTNTREVSVWCVLFLRNENSLLTLRNGRFVLFLGNLKRSYLNAAKDTQSFVRKASVLKRFEESFYCSLCVCAQLTETFNEDLYLLDG